MKVIGVEESKGIYEKGGNNYPYHNFKLHGTEQLNTSRGVGQSAKTVSVKIGIICELFEKETVTLKDVSALVSKDVRFFYNEYKKVEYVQIVQ